jgi:uncharacterized membrane protein
MLVSFLLPGNAEKSMTQYKKESHARSLLKGISWRIVATVDTVLVFALVSFYFLGELKLELAFTAAIIEFPVKYLVYYFHERVWENFRGGDGLDQSRTFKKSISWRIVATLMTFGLAAFVFKAQESTQVSAMAATIGIVEFFSKFALYYVHERVWLRLPLGRIRNWLLGKNKA